MVPLTGPFPHRTRPPEKKVVFPPVLPVYNFNRDVLNATRTISCIMPSNATRISSNSGLAFPVVLASLNNPPLHPSSNTIMSPVVKRQRVAEVNTQPGRASDYSAYVPVHLGGVKTAAYVDSGNTFANVISPQTMTALGITPRSTGTRTSALCRDGRCRKNNEGFGTGTSGRTDLR